MSFDQNAPSILSGQAAVTELFRLLQSLYDVAHVGSQRRFRPMTFSDSVTGTSGGVSTLPLDSFSNFEHPFLLQGIGASVLPSGGTGGMLSDAALGITDQSGITFIGNKNRVPLSNLMDNGIQDNTNGSFGTMWFDDPYEIPTNGNFRVEIENLDSAAHVYRVTLFGVQDLTR